MFDLGFGGQAHLPRVLPMCVSKLLARPSAASERARKTSHGSMGVKWRTGSI
jgi:hypothetical protein